jgi:glutathione peroxidase
MATLGDFEMTSITGDTVQLSEYEDKVCLIVNVASAWGLTPQYAGLHTLHQENRSKGFTVLAFPCNQFGAQEPGTDAEICAFATSKFGVEFPMFSKSDVNGDGASDLYKFLKSSQPDEEGKEDIPWNFTKFLVDRSGQLVKRYAPQTTPEEIAAELPQHLWIRRGEPVLAQHGVVAVGATGRRRRFEFCRDRAAPHTEPRPGGGCKRLILLGKSFEGGRPG